jgi:hypothetical protein
MSLPQITIQLYSLRDVLEVGFEGTIRKLAAISSPSVEPAEGESD